MATIVARPETHKSWIDLDKNELRNVTLQNLGADIGTPTEGLIFYRTDTDRIRVRANGVWQDVAWSADIPANGISSTIVDAKGDLIVGTAADTVARKAAGANGTTLFANSATSDGLEWRVTAPADVTFSATDRLLGRDTAAGGAGEEISVTGGIVFTGTGGIQTTAFTGDVTKTLGGTALTIANDSVTYAKMQNISVTDRLLGRDTAGAGDTEELTVGGGIEFTGSGGIQTSALTGDVTKAAGGTATTIANSAVTLGKMANLAANTLIGNNTGSAATPLALNAASVKTLLAIVAADVSDFHTAVRTNRLDQMAQPTADVPFNNRKITGLADGVAATDAATFGQISAITTAQKWKDPVDAASTANLTLSGTQTIDGVAVIAGDRVLAKNQSTAAQNGIYVVAAGAWTRATDADTASEINDATVFVDAGTTLKGKIYTQTATVTTLGTDAVTWTVTGDVTVYTADGTTLTLTGSQFSVATGGINVAQLNAAVAGDGLTGGGGSALAVSAGAGIEISADAVRIAATAAGAGLTGGGGSALAVGAGTGISVAADAVAIDTAVVVQKYATTIGNGALTSFTINHALNTRDVTVGVYLNSGTYEEIDVDVQHTDANNVTVIFTGITPAASEYRVVVHG